MKRHAVIALLCAATAADALAPNLLSRRGFAAKCSVVLTTGVAGGFLTSPEQARAVEYNVESTGVGADRNAVDEPQPQQMVMPGKLDVNAATVTEYKVLRGLYPSVAGKIASHGPYDSIRDVYKMADFTKAEAALFKSYEKDFEALPPGRMFVERINQRQSV